MKILYKIIYSIFLISKVIIYIILSTILAMMGSKSVLKWDTGYNRKQTKKNIRNAQKQLDRWIK